MKRTVLSIFFSLLFFSDFAQHDSLSDQQVDIKNLGRGQQNNNTGPGTQNIYNKTIIKKNKAYSSKEKKRRIEITSKVGFFGRQKDATIANPSYEIGGAVVGGGTMTFGDEPIPPILVKNINDQLNIFVNIRDSQGNMIATINGRSWQILNPDAIDYNNDDSAFEIVSGGRVIFQAILNKNQPKFYGLFCGETGDGMYLVPSKPDDKVSFWGFRETIKKPGVKFDLPNDKIIDLLFKYPRYLYLGSRNK